jgi:long-chain acyl-CoA synthetase
MKTIPEFFEESVGKFGNNVMMLEKKEGAYKPSTYKEIHTLVRRFAAGLMSLGVQKGDRIGLIAEGRNDWVIAELGILYTGAINVPLSVKIEELPELEFRLAHSGCSVVVVSGAQYSKISRIKNNLADLETVIVLDVQDKMEEDVASFGSTLDRGDEYLVAHESDFNDRWRSIRGDDPANICYTSGTTADPKGIVLSHNNYTANVQQACDHLAIPSSYCSLLILPWDHSFAHTAGVYLLINRGASMASVQIGKTPMETLRNMPGNIRETRPSFLLSVPSLAKSFRKNIEKGIREKGEGVEKLFQKALALAYDYNGNGWDKGKGSKKWKKPLLMLYDALIFSKIRKNFGGRLEFFVGGGALLDIELQRFFYAIGIPMYQGYGLTEAAPIISANTPARHKMGSSGALMPRLELKICDDRGNALPVGAQGEIVIRGENVMLGYWKNEKATRETIRDGWLYTGDIGYMDQDGFLFVLGREKSLLISHDGEKYSPEGIEEMLVAHSAYIDQMMLYNNQSPYTVALVVPNRDAILAWLSKKSLTSHTEEGQDAVLRLLVGEVDAFRQGGQFGGMFPDRWLPAAIGVLGEGFTEQNRFLNSTMKMVRGRIAEFYKNRIDYLFTPEGKDVCNHQNRMIIKRMGEQA